jgi:hypothetical protein
MIVGDSAAGLLDCRHRISLDAGTMDNADDPAQKAADDENQDEQTPHAESEPMLPRLRKGLV